MTYSLYSHILWLDTETTSLCPDVANVKEIAYSKEVNGIQSEIQSFSVSPLLHFEDLLYGDQDINEFCNKYNKKFHEKDPNRLRPFAFPGRNPLFFYSVNALTFNLPTSDIADPSQWLLGKDKLSPYQAIQKLIDDLSESDQRWILAGHNISFDYDVLVYWTRRALGKDANELLNKINHHVFLDTCALSRWMTYGGRLKTQRATLEAVASELHLSTKDQHSAKIDVETSMQIAKLLLEGNK